MWNIILSSLSENSVYLRRNEGIALLLGITVLACVLYFLSGKRRRNLPPGPMGLPVLGYYLFLGKKPEKTLSELGKKYGNVFGLHLGPQYMVFLNDWESMKDAMGQNATVDRPSVFSKLPYKMGVGGANGEEWVQLRRVTSKAIKDIGLHGTRWEELIQEEVSEMVQRIVQEGDRPIEVRSFFCESFANSVVTLILGERLPAGHPITNFVAESVDAILESIPTVCMMNFSPTLSRILEAVGLEKKFLLHKEVQEFAEFVSNTVDENIRNPMSKTEDSFITKFYEEVKNHSNKEKTYVTVDNLKGNVIALLTGGSETSRTTVIWTLIAMAENPDKQRKVHEELDKVIGKEDFIRWSDRFKIPYTYATLLESMRWATVAPLTTLRITTEDAQVQGYFIPKGTFVSANSWSLHNDPRYWDNPDQFIPERFLLDDGKKVNTSPESFNPFSYGKRICPGKLIGQMEVLQYFTILMRNFKVTPKEGDKVKYGTLLGLTYQATNVELRFIPR